MKHMLQKYNSITDAKLEGGALFALFSSGAPERVERLSSKLPL